MYITVKSIKRNLGFKGIEIPDIVIALPMIILFIVLFCFTPFKIPAIVGLMIGIFCLLPINVSKKNRMYKVIILIFKFLIREKIFVYQKKGGNKLENNASYKYGKAKGYKTNLNEINIKLKTPKAKIVYLTKYEQNKVEDLLSKKKGIKALDILMCLYTGLRIGELCALRWKDIDLENKCYRIEHTVQSVKKTRTNKN